MSFCSGERSLGSKERENKCPLPVRLALMHSTSKVVLFYIEVWGVEAIEHTQKTKQYSVRRLNPKTRRGLGYRQSIEL